MKSIKYTPHLIYIAIIVALCFYLLKSCGGGHVDGAFARLQKEKSEDSVRNAEMTKRYDDSVKKLESEKELAKSDLEDSQKDIATLKKRVDHLISDHQKESAPIAFDSTSAIVSNHWIAQCDTCFVALKQWDVKYAKMINGVIALTNTNDKLIALKDRHIDSLDMALAKSDKSFNALSDLYKKDIKPRYHGFMGVEAEYSQPYKSVGVWLMLQDKRGRMYGAQGGLNSLNTWYAGIRGGIKGF